LVLVLALLPRGRGPLWPPHWPVFLVLAGSCLGILRLRRGPPSLPRWPVCLGWAVMRRGPPSLPRWPVCLGLAVTCPGRRASGCRSPAVQVLAWALRLLRLARCSRTLELSACRFRKVVEEPFRLVLQPLTALGS
jgi:hypothetical protein